MEGHPASVRVKLGSGQVVEVVPLRRAWLSGFFLARQVENQALLMIHEHQVLTPEAEMNGETPQHPHPVCDHPLPADGRGVSPSGEGDDR